jgi:DNA-binding protein YbaB
MFGLGNIKEKLEAAKKRASETKERLDTVYVEGKSPDGKVRVVCTANRRVTGVFFETDIHQIGREQLQASTLLAMHEALDKAEEIFNAEMSVLAKEAMPNIPGMPSLQQLFQ